MYQILPYSYKQAKKIGVKIAPSERTGKKIDIYKKGKYILSIGAEGYLDYPYYVKYFGKDIANNRRKLYRLRHKKDLNVKGSAGYYANKILW